MKKLYFFLFSILLITLSSNAQVKNLSDSYPEKQSYLKNADTFSTSQYLQQEDGYSGCQIAALILYSDASDYGEAANFQSNLMATGRFTSVSLLSFYPNPGITVSDLQDYDAVIVYMNTGGHDYSSVSQALRDYLDSGGGVVSCVLTNYDIWNLNLGSDYAVFGTAGGYTSGNVSSATIYDPAHPILDEITTFSFNTYFHQYAPLNTGSAVIADWNNGQPAVAVRENIGTNNARAVDLNFWPRDTYTDPNAVLLMANSLLWASQQCDCPDDITVDNDQGVCGAVVSYNIPSPSGAQVTKIDTSGFTSGDVFPVGTTPQTWEIDFDGELKDTCSFTITVVDSEAPVIDCPGDTVVSTDPGECHAVVNYKIPDVIAFSDTFIHNQVYEGCDLWLSFCSQLLSDYQYTRLTMKGTYDPVGVTLTDPALILQIANSLREGTDVTVNDGSRSWTVYYSGYDNGMGTPVIELTGDGQVWDCNSMYAVRPCIYHPDWGGIGTPSCLAPSQRMTVEFEIANSGTLAVTDNCDSSLTVVQTAGLPSGSEFPVGTTTNTFTVTDSNDNTTECTFNVTVEDNEAPTVVCNPLEIALRENGEYVLNSSDIDLIVAGTSDNSTIYEDLGITVFPLSFECIHTYEPVAVKVTVEDAYGNVGTCNTIVTVIDTIAPVMLCQDIEVELDGTGNALIFPGMVNGGSNTSLPSWARTYNDMGTGCYDACGIEFLELSQNEFSCQDLGPNIVTMTAADPMGNVSTCQVTVTVVEHELPWVTCKDAEITLDEDGLAVLTPEMVVADYGDMCGVDTVIVEPLSFDCSTTGENQVTVTVMDMAGNESSCTATVMVNDNQSPEIPQADDIEIVVEPGVCVTPIADYPGITATDDCGAELSLEAGYGPSGLFPLGTSVETWKAEDQAGNVTTMSFNITVTTYNGAPAIDSVQDITMVKDSGNMEMALTGITPGVDCMEQEVTGVTISSSDTSIVKAVITYTAGNDSAFVTLMPVDLGEADITVMVLDDGGTDDCGTDSTKITFTVKVVDELPVFAGFDLSGKLDVTLYPNPTKDMVNLQVSRSVSGQVDVAVYTVTGKQVIRRVFSETQLITFSMEDNVSGMYFVKLNIEGKEFVKKLILNR